MLESTRGGFQAVGTTSKKAKWSLVLGILSICIGVLGGIPAIILGTLALRDIRQQSGRLEGRRLATAGIVLGGLSVAISAMAIPNVLKARTRAMVVRAKTEMTMIAAGIHGYVIDHNEYPPSLDNLTSPIPYLRSIRVDPFVSTGKEEYYDYAFVGASKEEYYDYNIRHLKGPVLFVLRSAGADKKKHKRKYEGKDQLNQADQAIRAKNLFKQPG